GGIVGINVGNDGRDQRGGKMVGGNIARQPQGFGGGNYRVVGAVQKEYLGPNPSQMPAGRDALHLRGVQLNGSHQWRLQLVHFVAEKSFQGLPAGAADAIFLSTRGIVLLPQPEADGFAGAGEILRRKKIFNVGVNQHQGAVLLGGNTAGFSIRQFNLIRGEKAGDAGEIGVGAQRDDGRDVGLIPSVGGGHQRQTAGKA